MNSFICKMCGKCCKGEGSAFLYPDDIRRMALSMKLSLQQVVDRYTDFIMLEMNETGGAYFYIPYLVIKKTKKTCVFLNDDVCSIHDFKPEQCRETPFVEEFFSDAQWRREIRKSCGAFSLLDESDIEQYRVKYGSKSGDTEREYYKTLKDNGYNLEKMLGVTLPEPKIFSY